MSLKFSPDGKHLLTGSADGEVRLWEVETGKEIWRQKVGDRKCWVNSLAFSADGKVCAVGPSHFDTPRWGILTYDALTGKLLQQVELKRTPSCLAFSPSGRVLAVGTEGREIEILAADSGKPHEFRRQATFYHEQQISGLAFTNEGSKLISSSYDGLVKIWNVEQ